MVKHRSKTLEAWLPKLFETFPYNVVNGAFDNDSGTPASFKTRFASNQRAAFTPEELAEIEVDKSGAFGSTLHYKWENKPIDHRHLSEVVQAEVWDEFDLLTSLLQVDHESVYNEVDRLNSEAELRYSIFLPLVAITAVLTVDWQWWAFVGVAVPLVIGYHGFRTEGRARERISAALQAGHVHSPTIETLRSTMTRWGIAESERLREESEA